MNSDEKIEEILKLTRDNNHILHGIRRSNRMAAIWKFLYWALFIGSTVWGYYAIQPLWETLQKNMGGIMSGINSVKNGAGGVGGGLDLNSLDASKINEILNKLQIQR